MPRPTEERRRRRWASKQRSGCRTCKTRRKKCDETKPRCLMCLNGKYVCDGYSPQARHRILDAVPRPSSDYRRYSEQSHQTWSSTHDMDSQPWMARFPDQQNSLGVYQNLSSLNTIFEPSNIDCPTVGEPFIQYFLCHVVPLLSTTKRWQMFWSSIVPQACWQHPSIHHAMIALAATYESKASSVDQNGEITQRHSLAVQSFTTRPTSIDIALILCRLFSSTSKRTGDWDTATMHMRSGGKILRYAHRGGQASSNIAKLMAPIFLCDPADDHSQWGTSGDRGQLDPAQNHAFVSLKSVHSKYGTMIRALFRTPSWKKVESPVRSFILIAWSIMTQAINSITCPDLLEFTASDPIVPAQQIQAELRDSGILLRLEELETASFPLFEDIHSYCRSDGEGAIFETDLGRRLRICVDNFVVQSAKIQPKMTAGTFWRTDYEPHCPFDFSALNSQKPLFQDHCLGQERRGYCLEFVCPYRSGFLPTFVP